MIGGHDRIVAGAARPYKDISVKDQICRVAAVCQGGPVIGQGCPLHLCHIGGSIQPVGRPQDFYAGFRQDIQVRQGGPFVYQCHVSNLLPLMFRIR